MFPVPVLGVLLGAVLAGVGALLGAVLAGVGALLGALLAGAGALLGALLTGFTVDGFDEVAILEDETA